MLRSSSSTNEHNNTHDADVSVVRHNNPHHRDVISLMTSASTTPQSPNTKHKYFTRSRAKDEGDDNSNNNNNIFEEKQQQQPSSATNSPLSSPSSRSHQIKYVMPAEQPMETSLLCNGEMASSNKGRKGGEHTSSKSRIYDEAHAIMRARAAKRLELSNAGCNVADNSAFVDRSSNAMPAEKKSWAQVLEEQLDLQSDPKQSDHRYSSTKEVVCKKSTTKKKKRSIKRVSILEQIYGKDIYLKHDEETDDEEQEKQDETTLVNGMSLSAMRKRNTTIDSPGWMSRLDETTTATSNASEDSMLVRPMPCIDQKVIGDLMSFNENLYSDEVNQQRQMEMELEDSRFLTLIRKSQRETEEAERAQKQEEIDTHLEDNEVVENSTTKQHMTALFQSTLLQTPVQGNSIEYRERMDNLTPVLDESSQQPVLAPGRRQSTKARTPYKQAMLDILYRTLAEARKQRGEDVPNDVLDCTMATLRDQPAEEDETLISTCEDAIKVVESDQVVVVEDAADHNQDRLLVQPLLVKENAALSIVDGDSKPLLLPNKGHERKVDNQPARSLGDWLDTVPNLKSESMLPGEEKSQKSRDHQKQSHQLLHASSSRLFCSGNGQERQSPTEKDVTTFLGDLNLISSALPSKDSSRAHQPSTFESRKNVDNTEKRDERKEARPTPFISSVPNLHSPSMRLFSSSSSTSANSSAAHQITKPPPSVPQQQQQPRPQLFAVPNLNSPSMKMFSSLKQQSIVSGKGVSFQQQQHRQMPRDSLFKPHQQQQHGLTETIIPSFPRTGFQSTMTFAPPRHSPAPLVAASPTKRPAPSVMTSGLLKAPSLVINDHNQLTSSPTQVFSRGGFSSILETPSTSVFGGVNPIIKPSSLFSTINKKTSTVRVSTGVFPVQPPPTLFAGLAEHAKRYQFGSQSSVMEEPQVGAEKLQNRATPVAGSVLRPSSFAAQTKPESSVPPTGTLLRPSSFKTEKQPEPRTNPLVKPASFTLANNNNNSIIVKKSAFHRPLKMITANIAASPTEPLSGEEVLLNTEVEVYMRMGLHNSHSPREREGASNAVAKLLAHGDDLVSIL